MGYKLLGFIVWHAARWYARRKVGTLLPSRRTVAAGLVGVSVVGLALVAARRDEHRPS